MLFIGKKMNPSCKTDFYHNGYTNNTVLFVVKQKNISRKFSFVLCWLFLTISGCDKSFLNTITLPDEKIASLLQGNIVFILLTSRKLSVLSLVCLVIQENVIQIKTN